MNTKKFDIHWTATQAEIRHWMQKESERMGDWLDTFVISWTHIGDEEIYRHKERPCVFAEPLFLFSSSQKNRKMPANKYAIN